MLKLRKATASLLTLSLLASSAGPQAWQAAAAETTGRGSAPVIEVVPVLPVNQAPLAPVGDLSKLAAVDVSIANVSLSPWAVAALVAPQAAAVQAAASAQAPLVIRRMADAKSARAQAFAGDLQRLAAPTVLSQLPAESAGDSARGAA